MRAVEATLFAVLAVAVGGVAVSRRTLVRRRLGRPGSDPADFGLEVIESADGVHSMRGTRGRRQVEVDLARDSTRVHVSGPAHIFSAREELGTLVASAHAPRRVRQILEEVSAAEARVWSGVHIESDGSGVLVRRDGSLGRDFWPHYLRLAERLADTRAVL